MKLVAGDANIPVSLRYLKQLHFTRRMIMSKKLSQVLMTLTLIIAGTAICASSLSAQTFYGSIIGAVADANGSAVPTAKVTLTNLGTTERRTAETDENGNYQFVNRVPGRYRLEIEKGGFKRHTREPVVVEVQSAVRLDTTMDVGDVTQVVEITAQTPLLQPDTTSLGQVVDSRKVQEMPLNGRNVLNLVALVPGVVPQGQAMQNPTGTNPFAWGNYQIGGGAANQSATFIDGGPVNVSYINLTALVPTQDAIQEFRVQTNNLSSEFGRFTGGVINLTSKSGSNAWHGSAYEFLRNRVLNANTFFNNRSGIKRPAFTQNQFGANVGGPVFKDKLFFFFSYEGFRQRQGQSFLFSVPTQAFRNGDFSNLRNATGALIPIYDPLTTCGRFGNPACAVDANGREVITRRQFPDNIIPAGRIDPTARVLSNLWSAPNTAGQQFTNINNFATNASVGGNNDQYNARLDYNLSEKQRLFGRYTRWGNLNLPIDPYKTKTHIDRGTETFITHQFVVADTYTLNQNTVADFRIAYLRFIYDRTPASLGVDLTTFGLPAALNRQVAFTHIPTPCVQGFTDVFCTQGTGSVIIARNESYSLAPSLTRITGRHTLKFGGELRRLTHNYAQSNTPSGLYNFNNLFTSINPFAPAGTGSGFASFLLGLGADGNISTPALVAGRQLYQGYYANDTFQVNQKLTLNYGLRWELPGPWTERFNRLVVFQPNVPNPLTRSTALASRGNVALVNSPDRPDRNLEDRHWKLFAPRLGFSYRIQDKTVVRGGYGIFYLPNDVAFAVAPNNSPVNSLTTPWVTTIDGSVTPVDRLSNPFPSGVLLPPGRNSNYQNILLGQNLQLPLENQPYGYNQQWNLNVQHELREGTLVEVAYAGSKGTHLPANQQLNQLPDEFLAQGTRLQEQVTNPFFGIITAGPLAARTVARGQLLRPFPQFNSVVEAGVANRMSIYHSMQVKVERRFRAGGSILGAYTWAKLISTADTLTGWLEASGPAGVQNNNNLRLERSLASFDVPHRLVVSYVLDLPVGKGRRLMGDISGVADKLLSGWGINGVYTAQSGFPLRFGTASNLTNSFGGGSRPNVVAGCDEQVSGSAQSRTNRWFNTSCFSQPAAFTFGTAGRVHPKLRAHGINNFDFALFKRTAITERVGLEFRTEFFNLFNRVQFNFPGQALGNPQFGVVSSQVNNPRLVQFALRLIF
ncbi:MAG: carboxypeptidase regulatory-like domain-containing protein [Blastocatellia bacterium]